MATSCGRRVRLAAMSGQRCVRCRQRYNPLPAQPIGAPRSAGTPGQYTAISCSTVGHLPAGNMTVRSTPARSSPRGARGTAMTTGPHPTTQERHPAPRTPANQAWRDGRGKSWNMQRQGGTGRAVLSCLVHRQPAATRGQQATVGMLTKSAMQTLRGTQSAPPDGSAA